MFVPGIHEGQKRYPKIGVTVKCHVGAENQTFVLWKSSQCSLLFISPMMLFRKEGVVGKAEDVEDVAQLVEFI